MSIGVLSWRTDVYDADTMTETAVRAELVCDTIADLPLPTYVTGYRLIIGSKAYIVADGTEYMLNSSGQWILQRSADIAALVADISQIEDQLSDAATDATYAKYKIDNYLWPATVALINSGAKNALNLAAATTTTDNGITFTVQPDFSIDISGSTTGTAWLHVPVTIPAGTYKFTGMTEAGGSSGAYRLELRATPTGTVINVCDTAQGITVVLQTDTQCYFNVRVNNMDFGQDNHKTVYPMLSDPALYNVTQTYKPYAPTNRQLYELIKSYHP